MRCPRLVGPSSFLVATGVVLLGATALHAEPLLIVEREVQTGTVSKGPGGKKIYSIRRCVDCVYPRQLDRIGPDGKLTPLRGGGKDVQATDAVALPSPPGAWRYLRWSGGRSELFTVTSVGERVEKGGASRPYGPFARRSLAAESIDGRLRAQVVLRADPSESMEGIELRDTVRDRRLDLLAARTLNRGHVRMLMSADGRRFGACYVPLGQQRPWLVVRLQPGKAPLERELDDRSCLAASSDLGQLLLAADPLVGGKPRRSRFLLDLSSGKVTPLGAGDTGVVAVRGRFAVVAEHAPRRTVITRIALPKSDRRELARLRWSVDTLALAVDESAVVAFADSSWSGDARAHGAVIPLSGGALRELTLPDDAVALTLVP